MISLASLTDSTKERFAWTKSMGGQRGLWWAASGAALLFCVYRLAVFTPQPLDSPNTLRPFFNQWFIAFLRLYRYPETAYAHWRAFCFLAALIPPALALFNYAQDRKILHFQGRAAKTLCSRALLFGSIAFSLFVCRYPTLLDFQLNPDEGEFLSAAHKLFDDGNFFRSVDCGTSGPMNIYPLMIPAVFGVSPDFASSRVIVLLVVFSTVYLLYRTVRLLAADAIARVAILPLAAAYAGFQHPNLVHYSSEHIPLLLISLALYITVHVLRDPAKHKISLFFLGALTAAGFFSKMQSVPILLAVSAIAIAYTHVSGKAGRIWKPTLLFMAGTLPLLLLNTALCLVGGVWNDFLTSYLVSNQRYTDLGDTFLSYLPLFFRYLVGTDEVRIFGFMALAVAVAYVMQRIIGRRRERFTSLTDPVRWFGLLSGLMIIASVFSIYKPHRPFPHYLLFLFTPVSCLIAWMLIRQSEDSASDQARVRLFSKPTFFVLLVVVLSVTQQVGFWTTHDEHHFRNVVSTIRAPEGDFIRALTQPGEHVFVWGWTAEPYLGSGRVSATPDLNLFYFFLAPPEITSYYRARFLRNVTEHPPEMFIDAVGPTSWAVWDPQRYNFEQFRDVAQFVERNYFHLTDAYGQRYFLRRDLGSRVRSMPLVRRCAPGALSCVDRAGLEFLPGAASATWLPILPAIRIPEHFSIEANFTPVALQTQNATIFQNEAVSGSFRGFRFQSIGGDRYLLIVGLGRKWAFSRPVLLPPGKPAELFLEVNGQDIYIRANGRSVDDMHLPSPMVDSGGTINIGSWLHGYCRFTGTIQFFQIVDLG